jgi:hypothetical protein
MIRADLAAVGRTAVAQFQRLTPLRQTPQIFTTIGASGKFKASLL